eukprot:14836481-Alexandrium_andersonii.AAC.1
MARRPARAGPRRLLTDASAQWLHHRPLPRDVVGSGASPKLSRRETAASRPQLVLERLEPPRGSAATCPSERRRLESRRPKSRRSGSPPCCGVTTQGSCRID